MLATKITVHGWADPETYPLQKKQHSFEKLREWAHLRPRTNTFGAIARVRNCVCRSDPQFLPGRGLPLHPHADHHRQRLRRGGRDVPRHDARPGEAARSDGRPIEHELDFFGKPAYLTVSGQLEGEIFACALGKIYTFGPTFRAENSNTSRHLAEFWMVEPEMAFYELTDNMDLAERFLKRIFSDVLEQCPEDMEFFNEHIDKTTIETLQKIVASDFVRLPYTEAVEILEKCGEKFEFPVEWGIDLQVRARALPDRAALQGAGDPVRLPADDQAVLHARERRRQNGAGDGRAGAQGGRDHRRQPARRAARRARQRGWASSSSNPQDYWWYLDLRRYGTVPHSGFGLGLERAVQFITGMANIRDVIPFPRTPGSAEF